MSRAIAKAVKEAVDALHVFEEGLAKKDLLTKTGKPIKRFALVYGNREKIWKRL